jgi:hypothetical protein
VTLEETGVLIAALAVIAWWLIGRLGDNAKEASAPDGGFTTRYSG